MKIMKNLTKTFLIIGLLLFSLQTQAQIKLGIKAGMNVNNIKQDMAVGNYSFNTKSSVGYHIGLVVETSIISALNLQTGILFSTKGYSRDLEYNLPNNTTVDGFDRFNLYYIEIPLHFAYIIDDNFQLYAGPYVAVGMGGKRKWDYEYTNNGNSQGQEGDNDIKSKFGKLTVDDYSANGDDPEYFKAFDFGVDFGVGYKSGSILVNVGYSIGLINMNPGGVINRAGVEYNAEDYKTTNRVFSVSLSYFFGE